MIDLFLSIANFFDEVRFGKRNGFGSFLWHVASFAFVFLAVLFFHVEWKVLGVLAILGAVICFFCSCCRAWQDMRKKSIESTEEQV